MLITSPTANLAQTKLEKLSDGIVVMLGDAFLRVEVCADDVIRIAYSHDRTFFARKSLVAEARRCEPTRWESTSARSEAVVSTAKLKVRVDLATGAVSFFDSAGRQISAESKGSKTLTPVEVQGEKTFDVHQEWEPNADESLYGLGQHQWGLMNIKGYDLDLRQYNTSVFIPFLVSSRGYGILWDNTSFTRFGDLREFEAIPASRLYDASGKLGGLTGSYYVGSNFEKLIDTRVDPRIDLVTIDRNPKPLTPSIPHFRSPVMSASVGKVKSSLRPRAIISFACGVPATRSFGLTAGWLPITGGKTGCHGTTSHVFIWKPGIATN